MLSHRRKRRELEWLPPANDRTRYVCSGSPLDSGRPALALAALALHDRSYNRPETGSDRQSERKILEEQPEEEAKARTDPDQGAHSRQRPPLVVFPLSLSCSSI